jgi:hypothetical protein
VPQRQLVTRGQRACPGIFTKRIKGFELLASGKDKPTPTN